MEPCIPVLESECVSSGGGFCVTFYGLVSLGKPRGKPIGAERELPAHPPARLQAPSPSPPQLAAWRLLKPSPSNLLLMGVRRWEQLGAVIKDFLASEVRRKHGP